MKTSMARAMELAREGAIGILAQKFTDAGLTPKPPMIAAIIDHTLGKTETEFVWDDMSEAEKTFLDEIDLTDADMAKLDDQMAIFEEELSRSVTKVATKGSKDLLNSLKANWPTIHADDQQRTDAFEARLEARWGESFDHVRLLRYVSFEEGQARSRRLGRSRAKSQKALPHLLLRLHARAIQTAGEILALMEAGYADGAMARWRTLHEVTVVALLLAEGGEDLAVRFIDHDAVGRLQAANLHQKTCLGRDRAPIPEDEMAALEADQAAVVEKYGPAFKKEYGWAAAHLGNPDPKFDKLEAAAGRASVRPEYKLASYNIHAGSRGLFFKIGTLDGSSFIAGSSDAGFDEPGYATLDALVSINFALMPKPLSLDDLITLGTLDAARMAGRTAFSRAATKLRKDHSKIQREAAKAKPTARRLNTARPRKSAGPTGETL